MELMKYVKRGRPPISDEKREIVLRMATEQIPVDDIAHLVGVSPWSVRRIIKTEIEAQKEAS